MVPAFHLWIRRGSSILFVKPLRENAETNVNIVTNQRVYALLLRGSVHSISKCDMPMISMGSPWRFWNVPTLFAAESD
ncbi:hypothetical protein GHK46_19985 [Sinorhizobium medicae]|nr:hypothetical protein [Sinorhizobium medicae]